MSDGIKVFISNRDIDAIGIYIVREYGSKRHLMKVEKDVESWTEIEDSVLQSPTLTLPNDVGMAMLDTLMRHYQGASDMHTVRSDYLHERGRVDRLLEGLLRNDSSLADVADKLAENS
jgi:hypothetical protein